MARTSPSGLEAIALTSHVNNAAAPAGRGGDGLWYSRSQVGGCQASGHGGSAPAERRTGFVSPTIRKIELMIIAQSPIARDPVERFKKWLQIHTHCGTLCAVSVIGVAIGGAGAPPKERGALMVRSLRGVVSRIGIGVAAGALLLSVAAAGGSPAPPRRRYPVATLRVARWRRRQANRSSSAPKGTGLTRGITSTSISVGCVYTSADYAGYIGGIQAAFYEANLKGIDGRKITWSPARTTRVGSSRTCPKSSNWCNRTRSSPCCR
jgi:hypothetical protein